MPTHGDFPWEQDERKRRRDSGAPPPQYERPSQPPRAAYRPPKRRSRSALPKGAGGPLLFVAAIAAAGYAVVERSTPEFGLPAPVPAAVQPPTQAPRERLTEIVKPRAHKSRRRVPAASRYRLRGLHSRWLDPRVLEVWGRTTAPDGTTIRVNVSAGGRTHRLTIAPAAQGRFYARGRIPRSLRHRRIAVSARITG